MQADRGEPAATIVVSVELGLGFVGRRPSLSAPFGRHASLLRATVARLLAMHIAPIRVCARDTPANRRIGELLDGMDVSILYGDPNRLAVRPLLDGPVLVADPRCPFLSPTLLHAQLDAQRARAPDLTGIPMAAPGLCAVATSAAALAQIDQMFAHEARGCVDGDWFAFIHNARPRFEVVDLDCDPRFVCHTADLVLRTVEDAKRLGSLALEDDAEDYERVFDALAAAAWAAPMRCPRARARPKPRILMAHYTQRRAAGSTRVFETVVERWSRDRWEVSVAVPSGGALTDALEERNVEVHGAPFESVSAEHGDGIGARFHREVEACRALLRTVDPDLVYVSGAIPALGAAARQLDIPSLCHHHMPTLTNNAALSAELCRRVALPWYDAIVLAADWYRDALIPQYRPPPGRMLSIHCGIDTARFRLEGHHRVHARRRFELPLDAPLVAVVGLLAHYKRPEVAIECLPWLPGVVVAFAGAESSHGYQARMQERADQLGVGTRVRFLGHIEAPEIMAAADLLLHCSVEEPFGLVLAEAMAMERPVVAARCGGPLEIVADGETGLLFSPSARADEIAALVGQVLDDRARAQEMGRAGRQRARDRFGVARFLEQLEEVCTSVLDGVMPS
jgi:glycosyltransferase involved in cell wall biosynthesis